MAKLNFQHHYSSFQCHMILQKSFKYVDLGLKKHFYIVKTVILLGLFNGEHHLSETEILNVFTVTT